MRGIARIDDDGVQLGSVRGAVLLAPHPGAITRIVIEAGKRIPGRAAIFAAEQALWRSAGIPDARLVFMGRGEPEGVIHRPPLLSLGHFPERRWPGGFLPAA